MDPPEDRVETAAILLMQDGRGQAGPPQPLLAPAGITPGKGATGQPDPVPRPSRVFSRTDSALAPADKAADVATRVARVAFVRHFRAPCGHSEENVTETRFHARISASHG